jgi:hypothetical protein
MEIQPSSRKDQDIESQEVGPQPIRPAGDDQQPILIRKLDRLETTRASNSQGA